MAAGPASGVGAVRLERRRFFQAGMTVGVIGLRSVALAVLLLRPIEGSAQSPAPNDPFLSVPPPAPRPRPAPDPAQPAAASSGYPVPIGQSFRDCAECPEMVVIPAGRFTMGSPLSEAGRDSDEGPQREIVVARPLAVGRFEVTFGEWDSCVSAGGCSHRPDDRGWGRNRRPVMNVSWHDAQGYVRWLSSRTGRSYRLLTEAEWEYAARAGTTTAYSFGTTISPRQANYSESGLDRTQPVGSYTANRWGLHDMPGNVWERVQDCYRDSYADAPTDASQAVDWSDCATRVSRCGAYNDAARLLRFAARCRGNATGRSSFVGFRIVRISD